MTVSIPDPPRGDPSVSGGRTRRPSRVFVCLAAVLLAVAGLFVWNPPAKSQTKAVMHGPLDADRCFKYLTEICDIGPRPSGSTGMEKQQKLITEYFAKFKCDVKLQPFDAPHPQTGLPVRMNNIIISWQPAATERVLLCAHYDTRPFPDQEVSPSARKGVFIGANDGASGAALFMELAHHMEQLKPTYGVDFVLFDGEELVFDRQGRYFLGSEHFARKYRDEPPQHKYRYGILLDMIADKQLTIYHEKNSVAYAPDLVKSVWGMAQKLRVPEFIARAKHEVQDDHLPLNDVAGIPTIDLIDFDYKHWHTKRDIPANCSGSSMAKVGYVLLEWLKDVP